MENSNPLVSFIMLSYNQSSYIEDAIISSLNQEYDKIEYIISDDFSTDDTLYKIKKTVGDFNEEKDIQVLDNKSNLGLVGNLNRALSVAKGDIIVLAAGDDISLNDRVEKTVNYFVNNDDLSFLSFNDLILMDNTKTNEKVHEIKDDMIISFEDFFSSPFSYFSGASRAFKRDVYIKYGDLNENCPTEDTPYIFRCLTLGKGLVSSTPGIYYRKHSNNLSSSSNVARMDVNEIASQYERDLNLSLSHGLIDRVNARKFEIWMDFKNMTKNFSREKKLINKICTTIKFSCRNPLFRKWVMSKFL
ncbi:glycosyltransferase [Vibrio splendidus]